MTGPYESQGAKKVPKLDWDVNVSGGGQTFSGGLISTGDNAFVSFQGQNYEVGTQLVQQYEQQLGAQTKNPASLKQYGIDPANWVSNPKEAGDEDVAGTKTTKVTGTLNVEKVLNDINTLVEKAGPAMGQTGTTQKLTPEQIAQVKQVVKDPKFEAFVAKDDKTLRRLTASIDFTIPQAQRQQASGASGGNVRFALQFANVGQPATVTAPTNAKPLSELQSQLGNGGLGGLGGSGSSGSGSSGSGGSGGGSSGSGSSPSSQQFQKYADCLQKANGDQAAIQKCSALLK
jgi:hypothetical protein